MLTFSKKCGIILVPEGLAPEALVFDLVKPIGLTHDPKRIERRQMAIRINDWNIKAMTGYEPKTTFYTDFSIADVFGGAPAVRDTFRRAFKEWKGNVEYVTELCMVLNWKIWEHYETNAKLAEVYNELWEAVDAWCMENLTGEDLSYFYRVTD